MSNGQYEKGWLSAILDSFQNIMKKHDMPEDIALDIERFVLATARDQFRAGSKSGAAYIYKKYGIRRDTPIAVGAT